MPQAAKGMDMLMACILNNIDVTCGSRTQLMRLACLSAFRACCGFDQKPLPLNWHGPAPALREEQHVLADVILPQGCGAASRNLGSPLRGQKSADALQQAPCSAPLTLPALLLSLPAPPAPARSARRARPASLRTAAQWPLRRAGTWRRSALRRAPAYLRPPRA